MEKTLGRADSPILHENTYRSDAKTVHEHRDRSARQKNDSALPEGGLEKISGNEGQTGQWEQVP